MLSKYFLAGDKMEKKRFYRILLITIGLIVIIKSLFNINIISFRDLFFFFFALFVASIMNYFTLFVKDIRFDFTETITIFIFLTSGLYNAILFETLYSITTFIINTFYYKKADINLDKLLVNTSMFAIIVFLSGKISNLLSSFANLPYLEDIVLSAALFELLFLTFNILLLYIEIILDGKRLSIFKAFDLEILLTDYIIAVTLSISLCLISFSSGKLGTVLIFVILVILSYTFYLFKRLEFKNAIIKKLLIISEDLIKYGDLKTKCDYFLINLKEIIPYDIAAIYFFDYKNDDFAIPISFYLPIELPLNELDLNIKNGNTIKRILDKKIYISKNTKRDKNISIVGELQNWCESAVFVPIVVEDEVKGLIFLAGRISMSNLLLQDIEDPLNILSKQMALAISNYRYFLDIKKEAEIDPLTGLYNRKVLDKEIDNLIKQNVNFSIVIFDLDDFKKVNDTYGHLAGDQVLKEFANVIKKVIRKTDIACRFGGEEILIILKGLSKEQAYIIAERIREKLEESNIIINGNSINVTVSGGIASYPEDANNIKELLNKADAALYIEGKSKGKNKIAIC
ncbi:GGDEF domain-containing protein [Caloramator sp. CAR-1]|uniref:GGDEF domain-containing protein n=1 Tax=Caloramator sp. CAR-1 TaxID=3062777 RepID=UPI0026E31733|nr:GGDEF domain-containing protein [Caloramator sp. CAR-1]